jgi:hypothetical protein
VFAPAAGDVVPSRSPSCFASGPAPPAVWWLE